jgi:pyruvate/2-oxoglutarate/acetoin dehydrogenase E1 component
MTKKTLQKDFCLSFIAKWCDKSIGKTGRVIIVEESPKQGGIGGEIVATIAERK